MSANAARASSASASGAEAVMPRRFDQAPQDHADLYGPEGWPSERAQVNGPCPPCERGCCRVPFLAVTGVQVDNQPQSGAVQGDLPHMR